MQVALLGGSRRYVLDDPTGRDRVVNFTIGPASPSRHVLMHSGAATPGRYIREMARRAGTSNDGVLVINPLLSLAPREVDAIVSATLSCGTGAPNVITQDRMGRPLAYRFSPALAYAPAALGLLSAVDADTDARLLEGVGGAPVLAARLPLAFDFERSFDRFRLSGDLVEVYRWMARRAAEELAKRDAAPRLAAVMPFHAGDLLFFLLALQRSRTDVEALVVDRRYRDIARRIAPTMPCVEIDFAGGRNTVVDWDPELRALMLRDALPRGYLYGYFRPSRTYDIFPTHLIDQYAFAAGAPMIGTSVRDTALEVRGGTSEGGRVLVHVDGGWPLKVYPQVSLTKLLASLKTAGFAPTIVSSHPEDVVDGIENVRLRGLAHLQELLLAHGLLIGMDSFPAHLAAHVLGVPTLCLFASTQPGNSDAFASNRYRSLEAGLDCRPCRSPVECPRFGGNACHNFVTPAEVVAAASKMWIDNYGAPP